MTFLKLEEKNVFVGVETSRTVTIKAQGILNRTITS